MEKSKHGRRRPGRQGCQPRRQTVEAQSTGRGPGAPRPQPRRARRAGVPGSAVTLEKHLHPTPSAPLGSSPLQRLPGVLEPQDFAESPGNPWEVSEAEEGELTLAHLRDSCCAPSRASLHHRRPNSCVQPPGAGWSGDGTLRKGRPPPPQGEGGAEGRLRGAIAEVPAFLHHTTCPTSGAPASPGGRAAPGRFTCRTGESRCVTEECRCPASPFCPPAPPPHLLPPTPCLGLPVPHLLEGLQQQHDSAGAPVSHRFPPWPYEGHGAQEGVLPALLPGHLLERQERTPGHLPLCPLLRLGRALQEQQEPQQEDSKGGARPPNVTRDAAQGPCMLPPRSSLRVTAWVHCSSHRQRDWWETCISVWGAPLGVFPDSGEDPPYWRPAQRRQPALHRQRTAIR